jgi:hypothetical protein
MPVRWTPPIRPLRSKRAICIWPLTLAWLKLLTVLLGTCGLVVAACLLAMAYPGQAIIAFGGTGIAATGFILIALKYLPIMHVWGLLSWEEDRGSPVPSPSQMKNIEPVQQAADALYGGRPDEVRKSLSGLTEPDPWFSFLGSFLRAEADVLERRPPDVAGLRKHLDRIPSEQMPSGKVMVAAVEAGSEWLAGRDWRAPLLACRAELGVRLSLWRELRPVRNALILIPALSIIPWAWAWWGMPW